MIFKISSRLKPSGKLRSNRINWRVRYSIDGKRVENEFTTQRLAESHARAVAKVMGGKTDSVL